MNPFRNEREYLCHIQTKVKTHNASDTELRFGCYFRIVLDPQDRVQWRKGKWYTAQWV